MIMFIVDRVVFTVHCR